jgi:PAS domain S-box-containing protein
MNVSRTSDRPQAPAGVSLEAMVPFFEASLDGIVVVDRDRRYVYVNPAAERIFGESDAELRGEDFLRTFPPRVHDTILGYFSNTVSGTPGIWEITVQRPDGEEREVQFSNLEFELAGQPVVAAIIRDLTHDRWRARESEAAAEIAATFTLDRPMSESLQRICEVVLRYTRAIACSAMLPTPDGPLNIVGTAGHEPGYTEAMMEAWLAGPPAFARPFIRKTTPSFVRNAREDLLSDPQYANTHDILRRAQWEHMLIVPMVYRGRGVGGITVCYGQADAPADEELRLLQTVAEQAAIAVENGGLLAQARERSAQLSALVNTSAAVASTLDLDGVMDTVLDQVSSIVDYSATSLLLLEGNELVIVKARFGDSTPGYPGQPRFPVDRSTGLWSAFVRGDPVRIADALGETQYARELRAALGDGITGNFAHIRSWIAIPLRAHGRLLGALTVSRSVPNFFTDEHEQLLGGLANHAAYGIERARLFREADRSAAETAALVRVASAMTFDQPAERTLDLLAENVVGITGGSSCAIIIMDAPGHHVALAGTHNLAEGYIDAIESIWNSGAFSPTLIAYQTQKVQVVPNVTGLTLADDTFAPIHDFVRETPWNTMVSVPLIYRSAALGTMNVYFAGEREPSDQEMAYLKALGDQAAVAGANLRLFAEGERRRRRAEALARVASAMTFHEAPKAVLDVLAENVLAVTGAASAGIIVTDKGGSRITVVGSANLPDGYMETIQALWQQGSRIAGFEAIHTGQAVVAHDLPALTEGIELLEPFREFTDREWATLVALPLTYRGESVGSLNVCFSRERLPDDDDMAVLRTLADQAAVTAANLQLFTESQQRRRRAETLAMVASALTGGRSIEDTLQSLSQVVVETTSAIAASVTLGDDERANFSLAGTYGLPEGFTGAIHDAWHAGKTTLISQTMAGTEPRMTRRGKQRMLEDPDYRDAWDLVRDEPWEAIALVPMVYRSRTVGLLGAFYLPDDAPDEDELALLAAVAGQAAVAVENRRLFVETERRLRQLEAVAAIASNLTFDQPLDEMMCSLASNVLQSTTAIACSVTRVDESLALPMRIMAMTGLPDGYQQALQDAYDAGAPSVAMTAYRDREAMIIHNSRGVTMADPRYAAAAAMVRDEPWDCVGVIPLVFRDEALGLLIAYYPTRHEPTNEEMAYLSAIADQAAIAIKNAALIEQAQESAAVDERQRLARELHDSVSQALYGIALGAQTARTLLDRDPVKATEPVDYVLQLAQAGLAEMRALIFELRPESLAQEGIVAALEKQVAATNVRYGLTVEANLGEEPRVPLDVKEAAYRIGQEAMHNTVKHAKATSVWITLKHEAEAVWLEVRDDGVGFNPDGDYPGHLGLRSMRERAARVRGTLDFTSGVGEGTSIRLRIPVPPGAEAHMPASMRED